MALSTEQPNETKERLEKQENRRRLSDIVKLFDGDGHSNEFFVELGMLLTESKLSSDFMIDAFIENFVHQRGGREYFDFREVAFVVKVILVWDSDCFDLLLQEMIKWLNFTSEDLREQMNHQLSFSFIFGAPLGLLEWFTDNRHHYSGDERKEMIQKLLQTLKAFVFVANNHGGAGNFYCEQMDEMIGGGPCHDNIKKNNQIRTALAKVLKRAFGKDEYVVEEIVRLLDEIKQEITDKRVAVQKEDKHRRFELPPVGQFFLGQLAYVVLGSLSSPEQISQAVVAGYQHVMAAQVPVKKKKRKRQSVSGGSRKDGKSKK